VIYSIKYQLQHPREIRENIHPPRYHGPYIPDKLGRSCMRQVPLGIPLSHPQASAPYKQMIMTIYSILHDINNHPAMFMLQICDGVYKIPVCPCLSHTICGGVYPCGSWRVPAPCSSLFPLTFSLLSIFSPTFHWLFHSPFDVINDHQLMFMTGNQTSLT
jgi:hypothetical protein